MKKLKLFLATAALLCSVGSWAYTVDDLTSAGWTQVTSSSITGNADNYYVLVDANSSAYVMANQADHFRPCYKTIDNPVANPSFVWILEGSNNEFNLKSYSTGAYFKQASGWNTSMGYARDSRTKVTGVFELSEGKYTLKCKESGSYVGHWNDDGAAVASDGEDIAANKAIGNAPGFFLYAISKATFDAALAESRSTSVSSATKESPVDVTSYIQNADWSGDWGGWESTFTSSGNMQWGQKTLESWNASNVIIKQDLRGVPNGTYRLTADVISGPGATKAAYVYGIGTSKVSSSVVSAEASAGNYDTMSSEVAGKTLTADNIVVGNNTITIGIDQSAGWIVADNFKLYYLGVDLEEFINAYNTALTTAQSYEGNLFDEDWATLSAVITANTLDTASATQDELSNATDNLNAANEVAAGAAAKYTTYTTANTLINGGENVDLTSLIINPSFEDNFTGWTNTGSMAIQGNTSFVKTGNNYCEYWQPNGTKGVSQTIAVLPAGRYSMTVRVKARGVTSAKVFAAGIDKAVTIEDAENEYTVNFALDDKAEALIGFEGVGTGAGNSWFALDNFRLEYVGALPTSLTAVTGNMNANVSAAQTSAVDAYNSNQTVANYNAALAAITAAETSVAAYAKTATALADANALKEAHNFATAEATTTFAEAIAAVQTKYDEGTLTDAEATAGANLGTVATGWHGGNNTPAAVYLRDGFALGDFAADPALHVNTWSTEGDTDGSGFSIPFYESWTADANSLPESTLTGTLSDLPNGLYSVTAWVRVKAKTGVEAAAATGITMDINGGGEGDYAAVDVTEGTQIGESQFQIATYTAQGLVKDGNLTLNFNIAADANISWLAFKNVKYTKVRDLTPEEMAVAPTAIALYNGETEVTEVSLDATTTTVTLTPQFTPADATPTVTWASSDDAVATVADGVVTAVSSGTTTITVKSTIDENVSASATVTVSFPETEVAAYTNDGATRYVHHYGDNIIKNGTFQYPNPFQGWKSGANGNCDANNFNIVTEDENKYIQAKQSMGAGDSHSISTGWPIEAGKTYVFGYKVKASKAGTMQYLVTSLTNSIGTETAQLDTENERKAKSVTTSWTDVKYEFTNSDNYAFVQFRARWMADSQSFDDFYLVEKTADDDVIGNVQYALDAIPDSNIGTGAFQYSQNAVDAANALVQGTATVADVEAAYNALQVLNAPAEDQLYNIVVAEESNAKKGNALVIVPGATSANNPTGYGLNVNLAPNTNLNQAVTFTKVDGNNYNISFETAEGTTYLTTGSLNGSAAGWKTQQIQATTDAEKKCAFTIVASTEDNVFYIYNPEHKEYVDYQDGGSLYTDTNIDHKSFSLVATTKPSIVINTTAAGWGTTMLPFAVAEIPEGVKVYSCAEADGATLTLVEVTALEANKPYIIEGAWNATLTGDAQGTALTYTDGLLVGTYSKIAAPNGAYILQKQGEKVGFFKVDTSVAQPNVPANRAYLTEGASGVKAFYLGGDADAIQGVFDGLVNGDAYDLGGRKVSKLQKGNVYIVNGKKVVVK